MKPRLPVEDAFIVAETSKYKQMPEIAIIKDFFIVSLLSKLVQSTWFHDVIFKGGTSLSKCYPNTIERFSEDIDLTYNPNPAVTKSTVENHIKQIEALMVEGFQFEPITSERSPLSKSSWVWSNDPRYRIKLELGATIPAQPFSKKVIRSYIHEYLEFKKDKILINQYPLKPVEILTLAITRTFIDKIMAIKRHAFSNTLSFKVRHIYDVVRLWNNIEIKTFIKDKAALKKMIQETKQNDRYYYEKRNIRPHYDAEKSYDLDSWKGLINQASIQNYENLHIDLLFTNQKQPFEEALNILNEINTLLKSVHE